MLAATEQDNRWRHEIVRCSINPPRQGRPQDAAIRESLALARALRCAGLSPLLGLGAPQQRQHRRHRAGDPDGRHRRDHAAHPRRQRRRDAAALLGAQSRRAVPRAGGHRPGPHRPGRRPRAGLGPADRLRAESARQCGRRIPAAGAGAADLGRGDSSAGGPPVPHHRRAPAGTDQPRDLDSRQLGLRRATRGAFRPALCVRLFLQRRPGRGGGAGALPPELSPERTLSGADRDDLRLGARGGHGSRGAAAPA